MATIFIPAQMRELTHGVNSLELAAATVGELMNQLESQFPGLRERLCVAGELRPGLQVSIDGALSARGLLAKLSPTSEVHFLPALGGG